MTVIALTGSGWLMGFMGAKAYFVAAAFAGLGAACVWLSIIMQRPKKSRRPPRLMLGPASGVR